MPRLYPVIAVSLTGLLLVSCAKSGVEKMPLAEDIVVTSQRVDATANRPPDLRTFDVAEEAPAAEEAAAALAAQSANPAPKIMGLRFQLISQRPFREVRDGTSAA